jgi:gamma-glutamylcyclotransferase (GGCT)/AIG2-like uncharacterized protein YtfP
MIQDFILVFVYGTLKPNEVNYPKYCAGKVIEEKRAFSWGQLFDLPFGYPAMTEGNNKVEGYLLTFAEAEILQSLDELEDYQPERSPENNEYNRRLIPVYSTTGEHLGEAWGYLMSLEKVKHFAGERVTSGWWTRNR